MPPRGQFALPFSPTSTGTGAASSAREEADERMNTRSWGKATSFWSRLEVRILRPLSHGGEVEGRAPGGAGNRLGGRVVVVDLDDFLRRPRRIFVLDLDAFPLGRRGRLVFFFTDGLGLLGLRIGLLFFYPFTLLRDGILSGQFSDHHAAAEQEHHSDQGRRGGTLAEEKAEGHGAFLQ